MTNEIEKFEFAKQCIELECKVDALLQEHNATDRVLVAVLIELLKEHAAIQDNPEKALDQIVEQIKTKGHAANVY